MTHNNFNDIQDILLRTWNRCALAFNIAGDHGSEAATQYTSQFNDIEKQHMRNMFVEIRENGYEKTKARVNRNVQG